MEAGADECDTMFVDFILWLMERSTWSSETVHFNTALWPDHDGIFIAAVRLLRANTDRSGHFRRSFLPMHHGYERHKHFYAALFFLPQKNVYINFGLNSHFFSRKSFHNDGWHIQLYGRYNKRIESNRSHWNYKPNVFGGRTLRDGVQWNFTQVIHINP